MTDWVAVLFIGFKVCILHQDGSTNVHPSGVEFWVRPEAVVGFGRIVEQVSGIPCSRI